MRFLIVFGSVAGHTEQMAGFIAEGVRIAGHEAAVEEFGALREPADFAGYDGYFFGGPTYHKDLLHGMKAWLFKAKEGGLEGKVGAAYGSHTHSGEAPGILHDTMKHVFKMNMVDLGPFAMEESLVGSPEGIKSCQQFGKAVVERTAR